VRVDQEEGQNGVPAASSATIEPPLSIEQASVDEKGRLKLPAKIVEYLTACGITRVFITTVDFDQVRLYPLWMWKVNEEIFANAGEHASEMEALALVAKNFGDEAEIDKSGRVLLPEPLRKRMDLEKQAVMVRVQSGRVHVVHKKKYDDLLEKAMGRLAENLKVAEKLHFK
jgi:MraZ protein